VVWSRFLDKNAFQFFSTYYIQGFSLNRNIQSVYAKKFLGVLLVVLVSVLSISAVVFDVTEVSVDANPETSVGGIFWENTTWTLDNSPYIITDTVQIPENVALTIESGVTVIFEGAGDMFLVSGIIRAQGTAPRKIMFEGKGTSNFFNVVQSDNSSLYLEHCILRDGVKLWSINNGIAQVILRHSKLVNITNYSTFYHWRKVCYIEYNIFIDTAGFTMYNWFGKDSGATVYIRHNLVKRNRDFFVRCSPNVYNQEVVVKYNSFMDVDGIVLALHSGLGDYVAVTATENYWGTTNTTVIDSLIYDKNDNITLPNFIEYMPILTEPHPDTPLNTYTEASGILASDTTWTQTNSPYVVTAPLLVNDSVTLTIEPGVVVYLNDTYLQVNGTLVARGTVAEPILVISNGTGLGDLLSPGTPVIKFSSGSTSWNEQTGIGSIIENAVINTTQGSYTIYVDNVSPKINNCTVTNINGGYVIYLESGATIISNCSITTGEWSSGITIGSASSNINNAQILGNTIRNCGLGIGIFCGSPLIEGNLIANNMGSKNSGLGGIRIDGYITSPTIRNNTIAENSVGFNIRNSPSPTIENNNIFDNLEYNIYLEDSDSAINATYNWWGTTDISSINQTIRDFKNDFNLGTVTFVPFLTEPNPETIQIPEFTSLVLLSLLIITTLLVILRRRKLSKTG
jgi:parallel beta-helix repeat protein